MQLRCRCGRRLADVELAGPEDQRHLLVTPRAQVTLSRYPAPATPGEPMTFTVRCTSKDQRRVAMQQLGAPGVRRSSRRDGPRACGADWQFTSVRLERTWSALSGRAATLGHDL